jgi:hypothetical protein
MAEKPANRARVDQLLNAAKILANPAGSEGEALRRRLLETTGLSAPVIDLGLARCLETHPTEAELEALLASTPSSARALVLLSGNVFVAALRAIALGVASSPHVIVRASRRDPALAEALHALAPDSFELTLELSPKPGDHFWAYGSDETLASVRRSLPSGVCFHPHGAGIGAVVIDPNALNDLVTRSIALDTALFDQRGCLSPRVVCVVGSADQAKTCAQTLAQALTALERELPPGPRSPEEAAEQRRAHDTAAYAFDLFHAGSGYISLSSTPVIPPPRRNLHVCATPDPVAALTPLASHLTCIASNTETLRMQLGAAFPGARSVAPGEMQRPPLDGPVDRRHGSNGDLVS